MFPLLKNWNGAAYSFNHFKLVYIYFIYNFMFLWSFEFVKKKNKKGFLWEFSETYGNFWVFSGFFSIWNWQPCFFDIFLFNFKLTKRKKTIQSIINTKKIFSSFLDLEWVALKELHLQNSFVDIKISKTATNSTIWMNYCDKWTTLDYSLTNFIRMNLWMIFYVNVLRVLIRYLSEIQLHHVSSGILMDSQSNLSRDFF